MTQMLGMVMKMDSNRKYAINVPMSKFSDQMSSIQMYDNVKRPTSEPTLHITCHKIEIKINYKPNQKKLKKK